MSGKKIPAAPELWESRSMEERRRHIGRFVAVTPTMTRAVEVFRRCYGAWHVRQQGTCSFIVGETGVGKTTAADEFLEQVRESYSGELMDGQNLRVADGETYPRTMSVTFVKRGHGLIRPVLKVFVDKKVTYKRLFSDTLHAMGVGIPSRASLGEMMSVARQQIRGQGIRLVIFDECQHIAESTATRDPYEAADVFKVLMKEARVQVTCVGLPHATDLLLMNRQLETLKEEEITMTPFGLNLVGGSEYLLFLETLSSDLPFDKPSNLAQPEIALRLHLATEGYVSGLTTYVALAADIALEAQDTAITTAHLAEAYRRKRGVPDGENPFTIESPNPEAFRERERERRLEEETGARQRHRGRRGSRLRHQGSAR